MRKILLFCLCTCFLYAAQAQQSGKTDSTLQQYVGKYKFPDGSVIADVTVALESGALTMTSSAGTSPLEKQSEDLFSITQFQGTAKFNRDANKKITGVSINAMGYVLEGTKTAETSAPLTYNNRTVQMKEVLYITWFSKTGNHSKQILL